MADPIKMADQQRANQFGVGAVLAALAFIVVLMLTRSPQAALVFGALATGGAAFALQAWQMRRNKEAGVSLWATSRQNLVATAVGGVTVLLPLLFALGILGGK